MFGIEKDELPGLANLIMGTDAIVLVIILAIACITPPLESDTVYKYVANKDIPRNPNSNFGVSGTAQRIDSGYLVTVDRDLSPLVTNLVIKHENCHVQQYKSGRKLTGEERELECYARMWLP